MRDHTTMKQTCQHYFEQSNRPQIFHVALLEQSGHINEVRKSRNYQNVSNNIINDSRKDRYLQRQDKFATQQNVEIVVYNLPKTQIVR